MGEVNDAVIKKTQDVLGKIIKKPPLTDKLLLRPPFRFLHDIMTSVIKGTGFMKGLFTEEEMNSELIKEKEQKMNFLQKVIDIVALATGKTPSAKPNKIVAGLDADKTNELLQALAEAASKSVSNSDDLVKRVLSGDRAGSGKSRSKDAGSKDAAPPATEKSNRKSSDREGSSGGGAVKQDQKAEPPPAKDAVAPSTSAAKEKSESRRQAEERGPPAPQQQQQPKEERRESKASRSERGGGGTGSSDPDGGPEQPTIANGGSAERRSDRDDKRRERARDKEGSSKAREPQGQDPQQQQQVVGSSRQQSAGSGSVAAPADSADTGDRMPLNGNKEDEDPPANRIPRPSSAKGSRRPHREGRRVARDSDEDDDHGPDRRDDGGADEGETGSGLPPTSEPRRLVRPSSARPAPPRVRKQEGSAGSAGLEHGSLQERVDSGKRVANLITENGDKSDEDDTFIIQDNQDVGTTAAERTSRDALTSNETTTDDGEHGGLVKKILETRKEFEGKQQARPTTEGSAKGDTSLTITEATLKKERELVQREVDKLRTSIQTLTRSANPLGKVMDYVQEDVDAMHKELLSWKKENRELAQQLRREQSITDSSVEPLRAQLTELEQTIADRLDLIAAIKNNITRNDDRIEKMLSTISRA